MAGNALRRLMMDETYLEVIGCLGAALVDLLGGVMDFNTVDGFGVGLTLVLVNVKGLGGSGVLRERMDSKRSFPVMSTLGAVLAELEIYPVHAC